MKGVRINLSKSGASLTVGPRGASVNFSKTGLALFFASKLFNISTQINKILISGYTQRLSKKTGNIEDQYVYSIIFDRESFSKLNIEQVTPYLAFDNFQHVIDFKSTYELNTIEPYTEIKE